MRLKSATAAFLMLLLFACTNACTKKAKNNNPSTKRYPFTGRIVSIDKPNQSALIDGDIVQGFMEAMQMTYKIKSAGDFGQLTPGDSISAEVVVVDTNDRDAEPDYWLENVKVTAHGKPPADKPAAQQHVPAPGEEVPDFQLTNQSNQHISFKQYRGQVLFVTFIYTRCPFPDFCPRVVSQFAQLRHELDANSSLAARTHLLCISFDPEHDTPKTLRDYAYSIMRKSDAAQFKNWEFAVPRKSDLPDIAKFFALTYQTDQGLITHSLSTAVISPEGKIVNWYYGNEWQVSDLMKDAARALQTQA